MYLMVYFHFVVIGFDCPKEYTEISKDQFQASLESAKIEIESVNADMSELEIIEVLKKFGELEFGDFFKEYVNNWKDIGRYLKAEEEKLHSHMAARKFSGCKS